MKTKMTIYGAMIGFIIAFSSCDELTDSLYTDDGVSYPLSTVSTEYSYTGTALFREFTDGGLEVTVTLQGENSNNQYYFPVHLHQGAYEAGEAAAILAMLNPVDIRPLKSVTILQGYTMNDLRENELHIKVHLAEEGPEADVVLVAGNVGIAAEE